jgi:hypothetical protein
VLNVLGVRRLLRPKSIVSISCMHSKIKDAMLAKKLQNDLREPKAAKESRSDITWTCSKWEDERERLFWASLNSLKLDLVDVLTNFISMHLCTRD